MSEIRAVFIAPRLRVGDEWRRRWGYSDAEVIVATPGEAVYQLGTLDTRPPVYVCEAGEMREQRLGDLLAYCERNGFNVMAAATS